MSNFIHNTGYIYPLPQMTDEERFEYLGKVNEEATFDLDADKFMTEQLGDNEYLLWVTSSSYGKAMLDRKRVAIIRWDKQYKEWRLEDQPPFDGCLYDTLESHVVNILPWITPAAYKVTEKRIIDMYH